MGALTIGALTRAVGGDTIATMPGTGAAIAGRP